MSSRAKRLLWVSINASFSHASLALPSIEAQRVDDPFEWAHAAYTLHTPIGRMVQEIVDQQPTIIAATAWLFNHEWLLNVLLRVKALLPDTVIVLGGPEFLGDNEAYLRRLPQISLLVRGEAEHVFHQWLSHYDDPSQWAIIAGLCYLTGQNQYIDNGLAKIVDFEQLQIAESSQFFPWSSHHVQIETTRGCFNRCSFCVSGNDKPIRACRIEQLRDRFTAMVSHGISRVAFIDRTFNADNKRALALLDLFLEFSGKLSFHLEIHPAILSSELRDRLRQIPPDLLHLEAGIQSLSPLVLATCQRHGSVESSLDGLRFLSQQPNLLLHTDLIAGLPHYTITALYRDVYILSDIAPEEIQLELLKVLPGTELKSQAEALSLYYSPIPPYEVLATDVMSPADLQEAVALSRCLDHYYNNHYWRQFFRLLLASDPDKGVLLKQLVLFLVQQVQEYPSALLSLEKRSELLYSFVYQYRPDLLVEFTRYWIEAGLSIKKGPCRELVSYRDPLPNNIECYIGHYEQGLYLFTLSDSHRQLFVGTQRLSHNSGQVAYLGVTNSL